MTPDNDPMIHALQHLDVLAPDATRGDRVKARCRAALERRQGDGTAGNRRWGLVEPMLVGGLSAGYLTVIVRDLLLVIMRQ